MNKSTDNSAVTLPPAGRVKPRCPVFGLCGGCSYQDIPYTKELCLKEVSLRRRFEDSMPMDEDVFEKITPSPVEYHYRHRLDLALIRSKRMGLTFVGFMREGRTEIISVDACPIAMRPVSDFLPNLKAQAVERVPSKYNTANLVVKTGDDGRVLWGGIGRRSLKRTESDYLWTDVLGKRIYYSMDTFFQANLSILPQVVSRVLNLMPKGQDVHFFDLFAGVGLFGVLAAAHVKRVVMMEDSPASVELARYNARFHQLKNAEIQEGRVDKLLARWPKTMTGRKVLLVDPPRKGLDPASLDRLTRMDAEMLFYLSCQPESLIRDILVFKETGWTVRRVMPFDFFPKTKHIETLVQLERVRA